MALHQVRSEGTFDVVGLLTTVDAADGRVAMHGVRRSLLEAQATALRLPLQIVDLPWPCPNAVYQERTAKALARARGAGVEALVFGDLHLEDIRTYRETSMRGTGIEPVFPLWHRPTDVLARTALDTGIRALVVCVDLAHAPRELAGRWFDEDLLADLPPGVDPCGERGEFHTVVVDGPDFVRPVDVTVGASREHDGFVFTDVVPTT